jgi:hypothetical protein
MVLEGDGYDARFTIIVPESNLLLASTMIRVSESNSCGVREQRLWCQSVSEQRLWCQRATVMVSESNGYGVREQRLLCQRATVMVSEGLRSRLSGHSR